MYGQSFHNTACTDHCTELLELGPCRHRKSRRCRCWARLRSRSMRGLEGVRGLCLGTLASLTHSTCLQRDSSRSPSSSIRSILWPKCMLDIHSLGGMQCCTPEHCLCQPDISDHLRCNQRCPAPCRTQDLVLVTALVAAMGTATVEWQ